MQKSEFTPSIHVACLLEGCSNGLAREASAVVVVIIDNAACTCNLLVEIETATMVHWHEDVVLGRSRPLCPLDVVNQRGLLVEFYLGSVLIEVLLAETI